MEAVRATDTASFVRLPACITIARTLFECGVGPVPMSRLSMMSAENWPCSGASRRYQAPPAETLHPFVMLRVSFFSRNTELNNDQHSSKRL
jgi:hypothetical protein